MGGQRHLAILRRGVLAWNSWRARNPSVRPDFQGCDLRGFDLRGASLSEANLTWANLLRCDLRDADLRRASLTWANLLEAKLACAGLSRATLTSANLYETDLTGADLTFADLTFCNLTRTKLAGARLHFAAFGRTTLGDLDLGLVEGLDQVRHAWSSSVGIDTIYRSGGKLSRDFLLAAGVPQNLIEQLPTLTPADPSRFYSCFISHSTKDRRFCDRLHGDLITNGIRTWYFPEHARWGQPVWREIDRSIKEHDKLVVVCSENSLTSRPVLREIERALHAEDREGRAVLFPIRIDDYVLRGWDHERRSDVICRVVGDFRGWSRSAERYRGAFQKLLEGLEAHESPPS